MSRLRIPAKCEERAGLQDDDSIRIINFIYDRVLMMPDLDQAV